MLPHDWFRLSGVRSSSRWRDRPSPCRRFPLSLDGVAAGEGGVETLELIGPHAVQRVSALHRRSMSLSIGRVQNLEMVPHVPRDDVLERAGRREPATVGPSAPLSRERRAAAKRDNGVAGGLIGAAVGSLAGPAGALVGAGLGLYLGHKQNPDR